MIPFSTEDITDNRTDLQRTLIYGKLSIFVGIILAIRDIMFGPNMITLIWIIIFIIIIWRTYLAWKKLKSYNKLQ